MARARLSQRNGSGTVWQFTLLHWVLLIRQRLKLLIFYSIRIVCYAIPLRISKLVRDRTCELFAVSISTASDHN